MKKLSKAAYAALSPSAKGVYTKRLNAANAGTPAPATKKAVTKSTKTVAKAAPQKAAKTVTPAPVRTGRSTSGTAEH